eukprot:385668-Amphidinium_carterae.1
MLVELPNRPVPVSTHLQFRSSTALFLTIRHTATSVTNLSLYLCGHVVKTPPQRYGIEHHHTTLLMPKPACVHARIDVELTVYVCVPAAH